MPNKHKNLLRLHEELRNLERPDNTTQNKRKKILAMEDAMQAKITQIKKRHEALRKGLENLAKDKQVQNTEIVRQIDVNTPQLDSSSTQELINTILPQDDVEEGCSGSTGAKGLDEEAGSDSSQDVTLPIDSESDLSAESEQGDIPNSKCNNDLSDPGSEEDGTGNDSGSENSSEEGDRSPSRKHVKMD